MEASDQPRERCQLPRSVVDDVLAMPEYRMGVHRVALRLADGRVIEPVLVSGVGDVVRVGDEPDDGSLPFDPTEVIATEDRSEHDYGWAVSIEEVSAGTYRVRVTDRLGRRTELSGTDPDALKAEAQRQAASLSAQ
jgi:hypothetical protein